jgi:hypothetical protein
MAFVSLCSGGGSGLIERRKAWRREHLRRGDSGEGEGEGSMELGPIEVWYLESSPHVGHFRKYPEEYKERLKNFFVLAGQLTV